MTAPAAVWTAYLDAVAAAAGAELAATYADHAYRRAQGCSSPTTLALLAAVAAARAGCAGGGLTAADWEARLAADPDAVALAAAEGTRWEARVAAALARSRLYHARTALRGVLTPTEETS